MFKTALLCFSRTRNGQNEREREGEREEEGGVAGGRWAEYAIEERRHGAARGERWMDRGEAKRAAERTGHHGRYGKSIVSYERSG